MNGSVYVITIGKFVSAVKDTQEKAEEYCRDQWTYDHHKDHRFVTDDFGRSVHQYVAGRSGRWNKSGYTITPTVVS